MWLASLVAGDRESFSGDAVGNAFFTLAATRRTLGFPIIGYVLFTADA